MGEFFQRLFDTSDFTPRRACGTWSDELVWLHVGSDLFIWLAYVSIPIVLVWFARRWDIAPLRRGVGGAVLYFVEPRGRFLVAALPDQVGVALFFFSGVACAMLGASERLNRSRASWALADALRQRDELEDEITLRRQVESRLR